ncbi:MAG: BMP family ABC transporter substrate-binding protein [Nitrososphaerales archaeon]|nr:BMP family ABC transporter substrate-binding protein [Nitrososphaerales archaeon]
MLTQTRRGLSTTAGVAIVIILLVIAGAAYYFLSTSPGTPTSATQAALPGKGFTIGVIYDTGGKGDKSFNDMAYAGVVNANKTLGVNYKELGSSSATDYTPNIERMVSTKVNLIIAVGFLMDTDVAAEAAKYPNQNFAQIDGDIYNMSNVVAIKFQEHVGSAIMGALAAAMTQTGKVGFIGGMDIGIIHKFWHGWQYGVSWGANYTHKSVTALPAQYTGTTPAAWNAPDVAKSEAAGMFQQGADIIFAAAGASGTGLFDQTGALDQQTSWNWNANTPPKYMAIGVDADQDYYGTQQYFVNHATSGFQSPSFILSSEMKRVDVGVFNVIKSVVYNNYSSFYNNPTQWAPSYWNGPTATHTKGVYLLGLAQHAVGLSPMTYTSQYLTPLANKVVAQLTAAILNGTAVVPENYNP